MLCVSDKVSAQDFRVNLSNINCTSNPPTATIRYLWPNPSGTFALVSTSGNWSPSVSTVTLGGVSHTMVGGTGSFSLNSDTQITINYTVNGNPLSDQLEIEGQVQFTFIDTVYLHNCEQTTIPGEVVVVSGSADFLWSNGGGPNPESDPYPAGSYTVTIDDNSVCTPTPNPVVLDLEVLPWPGISANAVSLTEPTLCPQGSLFGEVEIDPVGGSGSVTALWTPLTGSGDDGEDDYHCSLYSAGCFQVYPEDEPECQSLDTLCFSWGDTLNFTLDLVDIKHILTSVNTLSDPPAVTAVCEGFIQVEINRSTEDFNFSISPNIGSFNGTTTTFEEIDEAGYYTITALIDLPNSMGCGVSDTYEVEGEAWANAAWDFGGDGDVDFADLTHFLAYYGLPGYTFSDYTLFLASYPSEVDCEY